MPYTADISRANPACFLFLIDQSGSMTQALAGQPGQRKMDQAADAINRVLDTISQRCSQGMDIRDYFHIGVIGYNTDGRGNPLITSALPGTTPEQPFMLISQVVDVAEVEERQVKESDGAGGLVDVMRRFPVWLRPQAEYGTPMCGAFDVAAQSLAEWVGQHPDSFPPIVINVSDGAASDGNPEGPARRIADLQTGDGNALLFNVHLSDSTAMPIQYPDGEERLPQDDYALTMFRMSSLLPESSRSQAASLDLPVTENSRGYVFNADMTALVQFLDIGTRAASNLQ